MNAVWHRLPPHHQYTKVNSSLLAFFLARSRVFVGTPADFLPRPSRPPRATFRSLRAVFLPGLAPRRCANGDPTPDVGLAGRQRQGPRGDYV